VIDVMPAARRKITSNGIGVADARISILLPTKIDRQLRALSASTGTSISKIVRAWITEKLRDGSTDQEPLT